MDIRNTVKEVISAVQLEDERRNLQTLDHTKSDKVSYPSFSGDPGEDLLRFKEKINERKYRKIINPKLLTLLTQKKIEYKTEIEV